MITAQTKKIYKSLIRCGLFPEEQKSMPQENQETGELLYIDLGASGGIMVNKLN